MKCDGSIIRHQKSPWKGNRVPNLNGDGRFLRGGSASQVLTMQDDSVEDHTHSVSDPGHSHTDRGHSHSYTRIPREWDSGTPLGINAYFQDYMSDRTYSTRTGHASITTNTANVRVGSINEVLIQGSETRPKSMIVEWIIKVC